MSNFNEKKIFEEADNWLKKNKRVSLATVVQTPKIVSEVDQVTM